MLTNIVIIGISLAIHGVQCKKKGPVHEVFDVKPGGTQYEYELKGVSRTTQRRCVVHADTYNNSIMPASPSCYSQTGRIYEKGYLNIFAFQIYNHQ